VLLETLRSEGLRPLVRQYLARFPTVRDFHDGASAVFWGRPKATEATPDGFSVFLSRAALSHLADHDWPGNVRELRLFAVNALVHAIASQLDAAAEQMPVQRAPAILTISDALVLRLLRGASERTSAVRPARPPSAGDRGRRIEIELPRAASFARLSAEVERQYLRSLYAATNGDLGKMAHELLGDKGTARQVHLRLNQLGLRLRELRAT
jgi:DNA-binding NtrC family response regulator